MDQVAPAPSPPAVPGTFERGRDSVETGGGGGGGGVALTRWTWSAPSSPRSAASSASPTSTRSERLRNLTPGASTGLSQGSTGTPGTPGLRPGLVVTVEVMNQGESQGSYAYLHSPSNVATHSWDTHRSLTARTG